MDTNNLLLISTCCFSNRYVGQGRLVIDSALIILYVNIIGTIISGIVQIGIKKWYFILPQLGITAFIFYYTSLIFTYSEPYFYGSHKELPKGIELSEPLDTLPTNQQFDKYDLILAHSVQPGIYYYYTDFKPKEKGNFFIKAFEITSNDSLSVDRIKEKSKIAVENLDYQLYEGEFTIYEGSWGDKYGSRIELWFLPFGGNKEYKVTERNYIAEGWMR